MPADNPVVPAYSITEVEVLDPDGFKRYRHWDRRLSASTAVAF